MKGNVKEQEEMKDAEKNEWNKEEMRKIMKNSWFIVKENYKKYWAGSGETTSGEEEREGERKEEKRIIEVKKNGNAERPNNETKGVWEGEEKKCWQKKKKEKGNKKVGMTVW